MTFYLFVAVLLLLSMGLILALILRRPQAVSDYYQQRIQRNVAIYKQRLAELDAELADEYISEQDYQRSFAENARQLLQSVAQFEKAPQAASDHKSWFWLFFPAPLLALFIYASFGAYPDWVIAQQIQSLNTATSEEQYRSLLADVYKRVDERLQQKPEAIEYRLMLARAAMNNENYAEASSHYAVLAELLPEDANALSYYAQSEYLRENRTVTARVAEYLDKALKINPNQSTALGLLGISSFERADYALAIEYWQKLLQVIGPQSNQAQMIQQGVAEAKKHLAEQQGDVVEKITADGISLHVSLAPELSYLNANYFVFIYAKAAAGPPMPLAVKKVRLAELPLNVTLTDAMAMMPQMRLSQFDEIKVGARVSLSGQPVPAKGDWQMESAAFNWKGFNETVELEISEQVK